MTCWYNIIMLTLVLIIVLILALANGFFLWRLFQRNQDTKPKADDSGLNLILQQMNEQGRTIDSRIADILKTVDTKLGGSTKMMTDSVRTQFSESAKLIRNV